MAFNGGLGAVLFTGLHSIAMPRRVSNHASSEAAAGCRLGFRLFPFKWPAFQAKSRYVAALIAKSICLTPFTHEGYHAEHQTAKQALDAVAARYGPVLEEQLRYLQTVDG